MQSILIQFRPPSYIRDKARDTPSKPIFKIWFSNPISSLTSSTSTPTPIMISHINIDLSMDAGRGLTPRLGAITVTPRARFDGLKGCKADSIPRALFFHANLGCRYLNFAVIVSFDARKKVGICAWLSSGSEDAGGAKIWKQGDGFGAILD